MKRKLQLLTGIGCLCLCFLSCSQPPYKNPALSPEERANDLVGRLTLEEKAALMQNTSPAIPRLGIKAYDWWNEALHGVGRAGLATVFPQAIGMGASFKERNQWKAHLSGNLQLPLPSYRNNAHSRRSYHRD